MCFDAVFAKIHSSLSQKWSSTKKIINLRSTIFYMDLFFIKIKHLSQINFVFLQSI